MDKQESQPDENQKEKTLAEQLSKFDPQKVDRYLAYCDSIAVAWDKKRNCLKNPWMSQRSPLQLANFFKAVVNDGLDFDGRHITLQSTGVSYDYVAYKNKMLLKYPGSLFDVQLVYEGDEFSFKKVSGKVLYTHELSDPFKQKEKPKLVGCYCVIKNARGEFLTSLGIKDILKHKSVAKTSYIWDAWFDEMTMKTVIKKACKTHFDDVFQTMEALDNEQYDLDLVNKEFITESQIHQIKKALGDDPDRLVAMLKRINLGDLLELEAHRFDGAMKFIKKENDDRKDN